MTLIIFVCLFFVLLLNQICSEAIVQSSPVSLHGIRDFKQLTTTTPKWTTGSEDAQFAPTAHAIDETSVVVHL